MKWFWEVFSSQVRARVAYPWGFWLTLAIEIFVVVAINWYLWSAIIAARGGRGFEGYALSTLVLYALITTAMRKVQVNADQFAGLGDDIYSGSLNKYLMYPVSYFNFRYAMHLGGSAVSFVQSMLAIVLFWWLFATSVNPLPNIFSLIQFLILSFLAVSLRFFMNALLQTMAFWFDQIWSLLVLLSFLIMLLGGQLLPMSLYPTWAQEILKYSPFPALAALPAEALLGKLSWEAFILGGAVCVFWISVFSFLARWTFKRGLQSYSGIGA